MKIKKASLFLVPFLVVFTGKSFAADKPFDRDHYAVLVDSEEEAKELRKNGYNLLTEIPEEDLSSPKDSEYWRAWLYEGTVKDLSKQGYKVLVEGSDYKTSLEECPGVYPEENRFCPFALDPDLVSHCDMNIQDELTSLASDHSFLKKTYIGSSETLEIPIPAIRIGNHTDSGDEPSPQTVVIGGIHANEWVGIGMAMRLIRHFVGAYQEDRRIWDLLQDRTLTIVPVANPDSYDRAYPVDDPDHRIRTNYRPCSDEETDEDGGFGVDINRNFPFAFGKGLSSDYCPSSAYHGPDPLSEEETKGLNRVVQNHLPDGE